MSVGLDCDGHGWQQCMALMALMARLAQALV